MSIRACITGSEAIFLFPMIRYPVSVNKSDRLRWPFVLSRFFAAILVLAHLGEIHAADDEYSDAKLRVIVFGAHPDDAELDAGGTAAMWAAGGHHVKFVSTTNGDIGHAVQAGAQLARCWFMIDGPTTVWCQELIIPLSFVDALTL